MTFADWYQDNIARKLPKNFPVKLADEGKDAMRACWNAALLSIHERAECIAMPSTGDERQDRHELIVAALHAALADQGLCPNSCGPMTKVDAHNQRCAMCGFHQVTTVARA